MRPWVTQAGDTYLRGLPLTSLIGEKIRSVTYLQLLKNSKKDWRGTGEGGVRGEHQINYLDTKQI